MFFLGFSSSDMMWCAFREFRKIVPPPNVIESKFLTWPYHCIVHTRGFDHPRSSLVGWSVLQKLNISTSYPVSHFYISPNQNNYLGHLPIQSPLQCTHISLDSIPYHLRILVRPNLGCNNHPFPLKSSSRHGCIFRSRIYERIHDQ